MSEALPVISIIILATILMLLTFRRIRAGASYALRPLSGLAALSEQTGQAVEKGRQVHVTPGRAPLPGTNGPTSVAALEFVSYLAQESRTSGVLPEVTVGEQTLLPAVLGELHRARADSEGTTVATVDDVQFLAAGNYPLAYAGGVTNALHHDQVANNVAVGRFGSEVAIIAEAARRAGHKQILGSDDPTAMALATLYTENVLWGEEIFAAGAYLQGRSDRLASVRAQDLLRWLVAGGIVLATVLRIAGLL